MSPRCGTVRYLDDTAVSSKVTSLEGRKRAARGIAGSSWLDTSRSLELSSRE